MRGVPTVFTADRVARIHELRGTMTAKDLAAVLCVSTGSLKGWARDHGVSLARPRDTTFSALYNRLRILAFRRGYLFRMGANGRVSLYYPVAERLTVEQCEQFLRGELPSSIRRKRELQTQAMNVRLHRPIDGVSP